MQKNKMKLQILHYYYRIINIISIFTRYTDCFVWKSHLNFNNKNLNSDMYIDYSKSI